MKTESIDLVKLTASQGHVLTNGREYGNPIYLGKNSSPDEWYEITKEEYEKILKEEEEAMLKEFGEDNKSEKV